MYTLFQMPRENVVAPSCVVYEYGAQSQPPVQAIQRPPHTTSAEKVTVRLCVPATSAAARCAAVIGNV